MAQNTQIPELKNSCIEDTADVVKLNKPPQTIIGQGEGETRWKG